MRIAFFDAKPYDKSGFDLHCKTVGIVGPSKIGSIFAEICRGFGMQILAYDKVRDPNDGLTYADCGVRMSSPCIAR